MLQQSIKGQRPESPHETELSSIAIRVEVDIPRRVTNPQGDLLMSRSDPKETPASAAVTRFALFRGKEQGELKLPGATVGSGLAGHGVVITGSASSFSSSSSSSYSILCLALARSLASAVLLSLCTAPR